MDEKDLRDFIRRTERDIRGDYIERDKQVAMLSEKHKALETRFKDAQREQVQARQDAEAWRQRHPVKLFTQNASFGLLKSDYLDECKRREAEADAEITRLRPIGMESLKALKQAKIDAAPRAEAARRQDKARLELAKSILERKQTEEQERRRRAQQEQAKASERAELERALRQMAVKRASKALSWGDDGKQWKTVPEALKRLIEAANEQGEGGRRAFAEKLASDPLKASELKAVVDAIRQKTRGPSLGR